MEFRGFMEKFMQGAKKTQEVVVQKSGDVAKMTKQKMAIMATEAKIKEAYAEVGKLVYDAYCENEGDSDIIENKCSELDALYADLESLKESYARVRNMKRCPACQKENATEAQFCSKCGSALAEQVDSMPQKGKEEPVIEVETAQ